MNTRVRCVRSVLLVALAIVFAIPGMAEDPPFYARKSTWDRTMRASRDELTRYRKTLLDRVGTSVTEWQTIGPFTGESPYSTSFGPERDRDLSKTYEKGRLAWQWRSEWVDGGIHYFREVKQSANYLYREIRARKDTTLTAYIGSDDGVRIWVNGKEVFAHEINRAAAPNQETVPLGIRQGVNTFLMKVSNGGGPTAFYFSLIPETPDILWQCVARDFPSREDSEEMEWERGEGIYEGAWAVGDPRPLGERYLSAYVRLALRLGIQPAADGVEVRTDEDLVAMRKLYVDLHRRERSLRLEEMTRNIRTPRPAPKPRITGPKAFGARAGAPFQFVVTATGDRPMTFSAEGLPKGLTLDPSSGIITGKTSERGHYRALLRATNGLGSADRKLSIEVGDDIALTPPLGWNSWNCFADDVDQAKVMAAADAMVSSGLSNHGWTFINIDDCWMIKPDSPDPLLSGEPRDANGRIRTNEKFPDMKALADYVHGKGLKLGIYSSPGPLTCAGYTASYGCEDADARQFAEWGIDYLKYDWCSYGQIARDTSIAELRKPYEIMRESLDRVNRDIVYSLCQYGMGDVWTWGAEVGGNCWRTTGDITDSWESMSEIGFNQAGIEQYAGPGHWNDPDMLVVGWVGWGPRLHMTRLNAHEQYTHITLWALLAAPLLIGCDLTRLDEFTLNLLTNDEVLDVNQDPLGRQGRRVARRGEGEIWAKELSDGSVAVGLFNRAADSLLVSVRWTELGLRGMHAVRDVWRQKDVGKYDKSFAITIPRHGAELIRVRASGKK